jgi:hypothetical protein
MLLFELVKLLVPPNVTAPVYVCVPVPLVVVVMLAVLAMDKVLVAATLPALILVAPNP